MNETPRIVINCSKIVHNYQVILEICRRSGIAVTAVLKGTAGDRRIFSALHKAGLNDIGDSRIENLKGFNGDLSLHKTLLRLPSLSALSDAINAADMSLNSEIETIRSLDQLAGSSGRFHTIMLMVDLGDAREGIRETDLEQVAAVCKGLKNIRVTGVGSNFSCFAGVKPTPAKLDRLVSIGQRLREEFGLPVSLISGGNSSSLPLVLDGTIPSGINHLRIGEGILLGRETLNGLPIPNTFQDAFYIEGEVLQSSKGGGRPDGEIGRNAFGRIPTIPQVDLDYRALINLGEQDTPLEGLTPVNQEITILGGSSDYMVVASQNRLKIGERVRFIPNYWSLLTAMSVRYVHKEYSD